MFLLLLVNVNYLQGFETASLANEPGNSRAFYATQNQYERGSIVTSDNVAIAASEPSTDPMIPSSTSGTTRSARSTRR